MDTIIILQIVTIVISVISIFINYSLTVRENSKNNFLNYTTNHRLSTLLTVREKVATIINLTTPITIIKIKEENEKGYIKELLQNLCEFEMILKKIYTEEEELLSMANQLCHLAIKFYDEDDKLLINQIELISNKFKYLFSIYDTADWEFIKAQTRGKFFDNEEFLDFYNTYKNKFLELRKQKPTA